MRKMYISFAFISSHLQSRI